MEIREFIEARLQEDQRLADLASPGPWKVNPNDDGEVLAVDGILVAEAFALSSNQLRNTASFIAANDPARLLREVAAKRAILKRHHRGDRHECVGCGYQGDLDDPRVDEEIETCPELLDLASVFADHPDFDPAWRIDG